MNRTKTSCAAIGVAMLGTVLIAVGATAPQTPSHSVWEGIYTEKQAQRGEALFHDKCSSCHGDKLTGKESDNVPPLTGAGFMEEWNGRTVGDLFKKIIRKMPDDDPGTLTPQQTADLVAFLLSFNKFPTGKSEVPADAAPLASVRFESKKPEQKLGSGKSN